MRGQVNDQLSPGVVLESLLAGTGSGQDRCLVARPGTPRGGYGQGFSAGSGQRGKSREIPAGTGIWR